MKNIKNAFLLLLLSSSLQVKSQVTADPATGQMDITDLNGVPENANFISPGRTLRLKIPVYNLNQLNPIPAGTCKIKVRLGNSIILDPAFNLVTAALNNYFSWSAATTAGEVEITGNLVNTLPADFTGLAEFNVKSTVLGTSEIINNFLVSNHNTSINLADEDINNNLSTLQYTVTNETIPVNFTSISAVKKACSIIVQFSTEREINVKKYEVEAGKDGTHFVKAGEIKANGSIKYGLDFTLPGNGGMYTCFVRVRSVDYDGKTKYSETKIVKRVCEQDGTMHLSVVPNPLTANDRISIRIEEGLFNGRYYLTLSDIAGRLIQKTDVYLSNARQFIFSAGNIIDAGTYILKISNHNDTSSAIVKIVKL